MAPRRARPRAFTLLELLVSMGILVGLGLALIIILRGGLATWTKSEARRESSQVAQVVLTALREDLQSATVYRERLGGTDTVQTKMIGDYEAVRHQEGKAAVTTVRQRLFLVRTIKAESENPITGIAGSTLLASGTIDLHKDKDEASNQNLRPTGGLMEVGYVLGADDAGTLYRMVRSPIGGATSLFVLDDLPEQRRDVARDVLMRSYKARLEALEEVGLARREGAMIVLHTRDKLTSDGLFQLIEAQAWGDKLSKALDEEGMGMVARPGVDQLAIERSRHDARLATWGKPLASGIIYLGFEYWHQYSASWIDPQGSRPFEGRREHGALRYWDSTRGLLKDRVPKGHFLLFKSQASAQDPSDDVLPLKVRVTLVLREPPQSGTETELLSDLDARSQEIRIAQPGRSPAEKGFALIGREWIRYIGVVGNTLVVDGEAGRGARGTTAAPHISGEPVIFGRGFQVVIPIPGYREDWSE